MTTDKPPGRRATSMEELDQVLDLMFTQESLDSGLAFQPRPTDIFITPFGKSGTTWLQQIAHGLRTGGSMDFDEITAVTPWHSVAHSLGWDLEAEQVAEPRLFKSHDRYDKIPKGGRYIVAVRNPIDVLVSSYRFFEGWLFEPGSIDLESYMLWRWSRDRAGEIGWSAHFSSWWEQRNSPDVLLLTYEGMKADHPAAVRRVARFMGLSGDDPAIDIATRQSTREFMLTHQDHFDEKYLRRLGEQRAGLAPNGMSFKITPGDDGSDHYRITPAMQDYLNDIWQQQITARWGFADYAALRQAIEGLYTSPPTS